MILQALNSYYDRMFEDPDIDSPTPGFSRQKVHFSIIIDRCGKLIQVVDIRVAKGKKNIPKLVTVPSVQRTAGISANFTWDNTGYVLGADNKGNPERASMMFEAFKELHHQLCDDTDDESLIALIGFLDSWNPEEAKNLPYWDEMVGQNVVFQMDGEQQFVHEKKAVKKIWSDYQKNKASEIFAMCLVSGKKAGIARLHHSIKGVRGAQTSGAAIVSFNKDAFLSYGKRQSFNAPVSENVAFAYTTALNYLLRPESRQKIQIGDASTVFWTERDSPFEGMFGMIFRNEESDNKQIRDVLDALRKGKAPDTLEDPDMKFFILGLSPNASRLSVRFWHVSTLKEITEKIGMHFQDLAIVKEYKNNPDFPGMWNLLRETAVLQKAENVSPVLAGAFMRAILTGAAYPQSLLNSIIIRIRSDQQINYLRASMIKACLVRKQRINANFDMEVSMGLDKESGNVAYRLGRLFAVLEKAQKDAIPGANTTIKDRYYGSASATPRAVFPQLLRMTQHHIQKAEYGHISDKRIEEIVEHIEKFPSHLSIEEQGLFALGYYHQRPELYKKSGKKEEE